MSQTLRSAFIGINEIILVNNQKEDTTFEVFLGILLFSIFVTFLPLHNQPILLRASAPGLLEKLPLLSMGFEELPDPGGATDVEIRPAAKRPKG